MKYYDPEERTYVEIDDENLTGIYPRRLMIENNYEIWQHPYVSNDILESFDTIGIKFGETTQIFVFSKHRRRLQDPVYINRISLLVGNLDENVEIVKIHRFKYAVHAIKYMKKYKGKRRFEWFH